MPRGPQSIGTILADLMARRGFANLQNNESYHQAWKETAGRLGEFSQFNSLRRGVFEVVVTHSVLMQELTFRKAEMIRDLQQRLPGQGIRDLRFRLGVVGTK